MKPPQRTEAERIAGTLTKAQRAAMQSAARTTSEISYRFREGTNPTIAALHRHGLCDWHQRLGSRLTKKGLAVREVILSQEQTDER